MPQSTVIRRGKPFGSFTKKITKLEKGQKFTVDPDVINRAHAASLAWRAGSVIFEGKRRFSTHQYNGDKRITVQRIA